MTSTPNPRDFGPDPRLLNQWSGYSRDDIVDSLAKFYQSLPHLDPARVIQAPPGGWPEITLDSLSKLGMQPTKAVLELLRYLPYIDGEITWISPETFPINYKDAAVNVDAPQRPVWQKLLRHSGLENFPPWVVQLTMSTNRDGDIWLLDTMDGTVTKYIITGAVYPNPPGRYAADDPRAWRDVWCDDQTFRLSKLLDDWQQKYQKLELLGVPGEQSPGVYPRSELTTIGSYYWQETEELRKIYLEHGWPLKYQARGCRVALKAWRERQ